MKKLTLLCAALLALTLSARAADDIVTTAKSTGTFKTLVAALDAAGKTKMLQEKGPYTVFAPTDEAFAKLAADKVKAATVEADAMEADTVENLLKPENKEKLGKILAYHVMNGAVMAKDMKTMNAKTVHGADLDVQVSGSDVTVNGAKVVQADVKASNGVIHVIDTVLMPPK